MIDQKETHDPGEGFTFCEWHEAEEYACHLACVICRGTDNWFPMPPDADRPFEAQGHRFYYRKPTSNV
jgi:hypothetical protein